MGDRERRWAAVYAHRERLLRLARARVENRHDAEDCVQEAMLRCVEFEGLDEDRLGQFLTTVTVRLCADVHRGRARGDKLSRRLTAFWGADPGPEEAVCDRAESAWLSRRLADLTPKQRAIVEARAEGLSCGAVAERLVVPYTTVESAMARIRRSLRGALESSLGVAALPGWLRARRLLAGGAVATATAAVVVTGAVELPDRRAPDAGRPPAVAGPREVAPATERVAATSPVRPIVRPARRAVVAVARVAAATPGERPVPDGIDENAGASLGGRTVAETGTSDRSVTEALTHCVRYGHSVGRSVQCRYPQGDPRNQDEWIGTPGTGGEKP